MSADHNALLEAMEQQTISVAKAGILCNLSARTSVIAAANPIGGHYDKSRTVAENLKMNTALLSRFDLIFILLDEPDEARDKMLSEHVLALHSSSKPDKSTIPMTQATQKGICFWSRLVFIYTLAGLIILLLTLPFGSHLPFSNTISMPP